MWSLFYLRVMGPIVKYCKATMYYNQDYLALYFSNDDSSYWKRGSFIKRQRIHRVATSDNKWQLVTTIGTASDNVWQGVTMSDNKWYNEWQRMRTSGTTSGTTSDNEGPRMATSDNEWQWVVISANFLFFFERNLLIDTPKWTH